MPVRVVDASAVGALLFNEPQAEDVARRLSGVSLAAPAILWFEVAGICLKKIKKNPRASEKLLAALSYLYRLPIGSVAVNQVEIVRMARKMKLTTCDTSYLWLADKLRADLVTLDKKLIRSRPDGA